ncbi:hypothetical protein [Blastococcus montanus]|uniref:hypothetical protein n=1 Tax=Blastococcus montanus TaxID=3144973 RepID=UPI00320902A0
MVRRLCALVVAAVVSGFALLLITGDYENDGPVLVAVGGGHGVHAGDLFVLAGWAAAVTALWALVALPARRPGRGDAPDGGPARGRS